jgi:hypothetical protein
MEMFIQKAKLFAQETAKKSQEIAMEAAKLSQDLAQETAKRSRELSHDFVVEASKKADQIKTLANELSPGMVARGVIPNAAPLMPSEEELEEYGITPELREFVKGLTIRTFRDFPLEESNCESPILLCAFSSFSAHKAEPFVPHRCVGVIESISKQRIHT